MIKVLKKIEIHVYIIELGKAFVKMTPKPGAINKIFDTFDYLKFKISLLK